VDFRDKLLATLRALGPLLRHDVMVIGSEVPNLLPNAAACAVIVSKDVDIGVDVRGLAGVKAAILALEAFERSAEEPSILVPRGDLLEVNLVGMDRTLRRPTEQYVLDDPDLPLLVFGGLSLLEPGGFIDVGGVQARLPAIAGLLVEKLLTERSAVKGDRDLLVALALLLAAVADDRAEARRLIRALPDDLRFHVRSNLTLLSLLQPLPQMPDPRPSRDEVTALLRAIEEDERDGR
jgi:hypothetical protein